MKYLGVIFTAILSSQLLFAEAEFSCEDKLLDLTLALSRCILPQGISEVEFQTSFASLETAPDFFDFPESVLQELCKPACGQPIVDYFYFCGPENLAFAAVELCGVLFNDNPCYSLVVPFQEVFKLGPNDFGKEAVAFCEDGSCSNDCRNTLTSFSGEVGCCMYLASTDIFPDLQDIVEDSFWAACNMTLPEECPQPLGISGATTTATTLIAVITATVLALLV